MLRAFTATLRFHPDPDVPQPSDTLLRIGNHSMVSLGLFGAWQKNALSSTAASPHGPSLESAREAQEQRLEEPLYPLCDQPVLLDVTRQE